MRRLFLLGLMILWCIALLIVRIAESNRLTYLFLTWNLLLALVPLLFSHSLAVLHRRHASKFLQLGAFFGWLIFFPNAPYITTDFVHLVARPHVPLWFDIVLLVSAATTGLCLGYASLYDVQRIVAERYNRLLSWLLCFVVFFLSGFGIYLGRYLRWNSWDVVANPRELFADIAPRLFHPFDHPRTMAVTFIYGVALLLGYAAMGAIREPAEEVW